MPTSALHVARTGLEAQDARMRVIANNLANIGTTGFKRDRVDFATLAYQEQRSAGQPSTGQTAFAVGLNLGTGVQIQGTTRIQTQGNMNPTGNSLDIALDGDGFFQVELPGGGQPGYTRGQLHPLERRHADHLAGLCLAAADPDPGGRAVGDHRA